MKKAFNVSRRQFLAQTTGALLAGTVAAPSLSRFAFGATATPKFETMKIASVSPDDGVYYGWPTVALRGDELLVVASGGRAAHVCPFGRVDLFRSRDGGETWTWPQTIYDGPIDDRDAGICVADSGTILVTTFTSLAYEPELNAEIAARAKGEGKWSDARFDSWKRANDRISAEARKKELGCWAQRSTDGGITWSARLATPFNSPHGPCQLADGTLLYVGKELWTDAKRVGACVSKDDGQTWEVRGFMPVRDGDSVVQYHELHAVEATDGTLVAQIRNENKNNHCENLQTISKDGGETWSVPRAIGVWGIPSQLTRLRDGRLLIDVRTSTRSDRRSSAGQRRLRRNVVGGDGRVRRRGFVGSRVSVDGSNARRNASHRLVRSHEGGVGRVASLRFVEVDRLSEVR